MLFVVLCPGTPEGSTGSGSGFKASQKTGQRLKVSSDRLGEAGNRTCDPWFTRHRFIPYTTAALVLKYLRRGATAKNTLGDILIIYHRTIIHFKMICMCKNGYSPLLHIRVISLEQN